MSDLAPVATFTLGADDIGARGGVAAAIRARGVDPGRTTRRFADDGSAEVTVWPPFPDPTPAERAAAAAALAERAAPAVRGAVALAVPALVAGGALGASLAPGRRALAALLGASLGAAAVAALLWRHWPRESPADPIGEVFLLESGAGAWRVNTPDLQSARAVLAYAPVRWATDAWRGPAVGAAVGAAVGLALLPGRRWGAAVAAAGGAALVGAAATSGVGGELLGA